MAIHWNQQIDTRRIELLKQDYTYNQIAEKLSGEFKQKVTAKAVKCRCGKSNTTKRQLMGQVIEPITVESVGEVNLSTNNIEEEVDMNENPTTFKGLLKIANGKQKPISNIIAQSQNRLFKDTFYTQNDKLYPVPRLIKIQKNLYTELTALKPKKILSLSDIHIPYHHVPAIEKTILDNQDADIVVLNGDILDGTAFSKFPSLENVDYNVEVNNVNTLLETLSKRFKAIVWVAGNHDVGRFETYIARTMRDNLKEYAYSSLDIRKAFANSFKNLYIVPDNWVEIGDVIFAHKNYFSSQTTKTVKKYSEVFAAMSAHGLIPNTDYRVVIAGHTHKANSHFDVATGRRIKLIEQGCLCEPYTYKYKEFGSLSWDLAYSVVHYDDNMKAIFNPTDYQTLDDMPSVWRTSQND